MSGASPEYAAMICVAKGNRKLLQVIFAILFISRVKFNQKGTNSLACQLYSKS